MQVQGTSLFHMHQKCWIYSRSPYKECNFTKVCTENTFVKLMVSQHTQKKSHKPDLEESGLFFSTMPVSIVLSSTSPYIEACLAFRQRERWERCG